jgi:hypothetical protein
VQGRSERFVQCAVCGVHCGNTVDRASGQGQAGAGAIHGYGAACCARAFASGSMVLEHSDDAPASAPKAGRLGGYRSNGPPATGGTAR